MNKIPRIILVLALTVLFAVGSVLMIGPQVMIIVSLTALGGIIFAAKRSSLWLVCLGYPLSFGLASA